MHGSNQSSSEGTMLGLLLSLYAHSSVCMRPGLAIYYNVANDWYGIVVFIALWIIATASMHITCKHARVPRVFGVPLFPWVPSGSVILNWYAGHRTHISSAVVKRNLAARSEKQICMLFAACNDNTAALASQHYRFSWVSDREYLQHTLGHAE
jgi:hypothetical protein